MAVATQQQREVSPIPPGRYWIFVDGVPDIRDFDAWIRDMRGAAVVETSELDQSGPRPVQFVIFRVPEGRMPFLSAPQFGFPSFAPPEVTSSRDVVQNEPTEDPIEALKRGAQGVATTAEFVGLLLLVAMMSSRH